MFGMLLVASMLVALPATRNYELWIVLRFLLGVGHSLIFTTGDNWVNHVVEDRVRGRWMGIYITISLTGWTTGPVLGSMLDPQSLTPFLVGVAAIVVASLLLTQSRPLDVRLAQESGRSMESTHMLMVILVAPTVLLSGAMVGIVEGGLQSFAHLYTMTVIGSDYRAVGYAVIWVGTMSGIFFQYPVGWLADKVDRGWLLVTCVGIAGLMMSLVPLLISGAVNPWWTPSALAFWAVICLWGGAMAATDTVGITLLGERFKGVGLVTANATFAVLFGIGGMIGPSLVGTAMDHFGASGFPGSLLMVLITFWLFALYRQITRSKRPSQ